MKKRFFGLIALTLMTAMLFVGCGSKEEAADNTGNTAASTDSNSAAATPTQAADNTAASDTSSTSDTLIVGTEASFAPYEYLDDGDNVVGIDMDIAKAIADDMGKKLEIKNMDFDGALMAVQNGTVDLVAAGVSVSEDRKKVMDFSDDYVNSTEAIVVNKANPAVAGTTVDDLAGKVVGVQQGNIADFYVEENAKPKDIKRYTKFAQAAEDLKNNKIDCIVMDQVPAQDMVKANPELVILEGAPLFEDKYAIAVKKGNTALLDEVNKVIGQLKADGKIDEFITNHTSK